jgi:hypothetical protein
MGETCSTHGKVNNISNIVLLNVIYKITIDMFFSVVSLLLAGIFGYDLK